MTDPPTWFGPNSVFDQWMMVNGALVFAAILGGFGLLMCVLGFSSLRDWRRGKRIADTMHDFPSVPGRIVTSELGISTDEYNIEEYVPLITFTYLVDGRSYTGDKILPVPFLPTIEKTGADTWLIAYPFGAEVPVYYDPKHPEIAILERQAEHVQHVAGEMNGSGLALLLGGLALLFVAGWLCVHPMSGNPI